MDLDVLRHDGFRTIAGVGVGYGLILLVILVLFFLVPYAVLLGL